MKLSTWILDVLIGVDETANAVSGGNPYDTISARLGRAMKTSRFARAACKVLGWVFRNPNHCQQAIIDEQAARK